MSATLIYSTGVKGPHNKRGQIRCKRGLPSFLRLGSGGNLIPVIVRGLMGAGSLLLSRVGLFSGGVDFFWADFQDSVRSVSYTHLTLPTICSV